MLQQLAISWLHKPRFRWKVTEGPERQDIDAEPQRHNAKPVEMLTQIKATIKSGVYTCEGFSRSEIEQASVSSLYSAFTQNTGPGTAHVLQEINRTRPLSVLRQEKVTSLRAWASNRTVPAH